ncbi:NAD(P)/FAD-dependent oxidoreductase [Protofrankia symbiont of Coriaria ruscifolia]|uniref:Ferredoxin-NAD(+) reductase n=1 Tax=Candidatus Protofrankia californiensis TaxID=1839754 RepID=A0A1C3NZ29_9ACTN|nr:FAD-dependent oxidoreductase [Protofrankia symbiont of Coriaria ruscifolia]SBW22785.1 ferredoxin-NAD(+) reductase [Candidatus Protofrankia californiensis]
MTQQRVSSDDRRVVVVGGGHAGGTLVGMLRQAGFAGEIVMFGQETDFPYHRPPLSKKFIDGDLEQWLRAPEFYREQNISVRLGESIESIDPAAYRVYSSSAQATEYDLLVLATGAEPRRLPVPGADLAGVLALRTLADARLLREAVVSRGRIAIIGGGYVGLEVAAVARANGVDVTIIEREDRVLARVASSRLSEILAAYHRERGTKILTGAQIVGLSGDDGHVRGVLLGDGTQVPCDIALVGIGAVPRDGLAVAAGLACEQGILVDHRARTSDPAIFAIGDVTRRPLAGVDGLQRLESIPSAVEQARQATASIVGAASAPAEVPWFWSDQFDLKLKIAGVVSTPPGTVLRGDPASGRFALFHHMDGKIMAVESANSPGEFMAGKKLIAGGERIDPRRLTDPAVSLRDTVIK